MSIKGSGNLIISKSAGEPLGFLFFYKNKKDIILDKLEACENLYHKKPSAVYNIFRYRAESALPYNPRC